MKTGFTPWLFSLSGYLLPYTFVLSPALLAVGSISGIAVATVTAAIGVMSLGVAVAGHLRARLTHVQRVSLFLAAAVLINPVLTTDLIGLALLAAVLLRQYPVSALRFPSSA